MVKVKAARPITGMLKSTSGPTRSRRFIFTNKKGKVMAQTLLEKAKMVKRRLRPVRGYSDEQIDVAIAWATDEIGMAQAKFVLSEEKTGRNIQGKLGVLLREAVRRGFLVEPKKS